MRIDVPDTILAAEDLGRVHFIGIGGAGLSAIARIMAQRGIRVSGSDAQDSAVLRALAAEGIDARAGHDAAVLDGVDTVIASTAISADNPEVRRAVDDDLRLWPRSAGLQSVLAGRRVLAVAGTHGKTTTTSMATLALRSAGRDVSFAIGAEVPALGTNARHGGDEVFVVEADESDGAFLVYEPAGAIVTNVDADHLDQWGTEETYRDAFARFAGRVGEFCVVGADDPRAVRLIRSGAAENTRIRTAGFDEFADVRGVDLQSSGSTSTVRVLVDGAEAATVRVNVPGRHYVADALMAFAAGLELGAEPAALADGLAEYTGAQRRMQFIGEAAGVRVFDTYAHHPVEIDADLAAARTLAGQGRVVVVFQPHLVSRTRLFGAEMGRALSAADVVAVLDLYLAREEPDPEVGRHLITDRIAGAEILPVHRLADVPAELVTQVRPGDVVVTMGAGDITTAAPLIVEQVQGRE